MLTARTTLILGEGLTAEKLRNLFGVPGIAWRRLSNLQQSGLTGLILCVDEIHDLAATLESLGEFCKAIKRFA
ncbi:MAG: hypothetical protein L0Y39_04850, partial [Methylococcaceae bacterium]|nr:hypothetical protein [Methylococcaceae bacterium]